MTREHKLALLVGFGLVLVVGILISDHFSKARTAQLSADVNADGAENFGAVALADPDPALANPIPTDPLAAAMSEPAPMMAAPEPATRPVEIVMGGSPAPLGERPRIDGSDLAGTVVSYGERTGGSLGLLGGQSLPHAAEMSAPVAMVPPEPEDDEPVAAAPEPRQAASVLPVSNGPLLSHEVVKGDNLTKITTRYYGDKSLWPLLQSYNTGRIAANGMVRQGTTLLIPPKDVLTGRARLAADTRAVPAGTAAAQPRKPVGKREAEKAPAKGSKPSRPAPRTYTVKSGDTLGKIAQRHLGASKRWREILDLNKSKLGNEDAIQVGMVLALPAE